uniref:Myb-like domain-containing protein n=1 Tax=Brassica campestris TaxID=3711 RepID=M4CKM9_BRACM
MNHQNTYFGNSTMSPESSGMNHLSGTATNWSSEEQAILEDALVRYSSDPSPSISRYAKIASELHHKTVRDVALRCRWINESIDKVVASNSAPHLLREEDGVIIELLKQNELFLNQIHTNLTSSSMLKENLKLFCKTRQNIKNLLKNLQENAPEPMKRMPWPEKLSDDHDELLDSILDLSASPRQQPSPEEFDHDQLLGSLFRPSTSPKQP